MKFRNKLALISALIIALVVIYIVMHYPLVSHQILFLIGVLLTLCISIVWVYRTITIPIISLQEAVSYIAEGDLDYHFDVDVPDDDIGQLCYDFERMREKLKRSTFEKYAAEELNRELINNITHDIDTPLTAIKGYVEGIMDGVANTDEKKERYIKTIYNKTKEMAQMIEELTLYSKMDSNQIPFNFEKINVKRYFKECSEDLLLDLEVRGVKFEYDCEVDGQARFIIDSEQLRRVINNIMTNSIKYMDKSKDEKIFRMRVKEVQNMIQLELSDNGVGIAEEDMPYVFDRFYRGDASRNTSNSGSGIGLSIVKRIIDAHGSKIFINSDIGKGTVIYIMIKKDQEGALNE